MSGTGRIAALASTAALPTRRLLLAAFACSNIYKGCIYGTVPLAVSSAGATLLSFVLAIVHFTLELLVFKTMAWQFALQPMVVAGAWATLP